MGEEINLFHKGIWHYSIGSKKYFKVGAYDFEDLEYIEKDNGNIYLPEKDKIYKDLETAYLLENSIWVSRESKYDNMEFDLCPYTEEGEEYEVV